MFAEALARTLRQMPEAAFLKVLGLALVLTATTLGLAIFVAQYSAFQLYPAGGGWMSHMAAWAVGFVALWLAFVLFVPVCAVFSGIFLDDIIDAVEARYYPNRLAGARLGLAKSAWLGVKLGFYVLVFNILAMPLYVLTFWIPLMPVVIFYGLNSYLMGRGYYELVALRHLGSVESSRNRKRLRFTVLAAGLMITVLFTIPFLNLMAPILGAAFLVHVFHRSHVPLKLEI